MIHSDKLHGGNYMEAFVPRSCQFRVAEAGRWFRTRRQQRLARGNAAASTKRQYHWKQNKAGPCRVARWKQRCQGTRRAASRDTGKTGSSGRGGKKRQKRACCRSWRSNLTELAASYCFVMPMRRSDCCLFRPVDGRAEAISSMRKLFRHGIDYTFLAVE